MHYALEYLIAQQHWPVMAVPRGANLTGFAHDAVPFVGVEGIRTYFDEPPVGFAGLLGLDLDAHALSVAADEMPLWCRLSIR